MTSITTVSSSNRDLSVKVTNKHIKAVEKRDRKELLKERDNTT